LFITPRPSDPRLPRLSEDIVDGEIGIYKGVGEFVEDGCGEEKGDAEVGRGEVDVFAFGGGDVGHALDGREPVSPVVVVWFCLTAGYLDEFDVVVVNLDGGTSCISGISLSASNLTFLCKGQK
jgi:hypothetical protein